METVRRKKDFSETYDQKICPRIIKKLEKEKDNCRWWQATLAGGDKYSVSHGL